MFRIPRINNSSPQALPHEQANNLIADAHRDDGKRFVVRADEKLTAFAPSENVVTVDF